MSFTANDQLLVSDQNSVPSVISGNNLAVNANSSATNSPGQPLANQNIMQSSVLFQEFNPEVEDIAFYLDCFDCFALGNGINNNKKPKLYIACLGATVCPRLLLLAIPKKPMQLTFVEIESLLRGEYKKKPLVHVVWHNFRQRKQEPGESFRDYYNALKELSQDCIFEVAEMLKDELKSQIFLGMRDAKMQSYFYASEVNIRWCSDRWAGRWQSAAFPPR